MRVTRQPALWLNDPNIRTLQEACKRYRREAHTPPHSEAGWDIFKDARNSLKKLIGKAKRRFMTNALSYERPNEVWKTIHRILYPSQQPITVYANNKHFASAAEGVDASVGTLRSNDADGNEKVKKTVSLISKTTTSHVHHTFFVHFSPVFARLRHENALFRVLRRTQTRNDEILFLFLSLIQGHSKFSFIGGFAYI